MGYHNYISFSRVNWHARTYIRNARELDKLPPRVALETRGHTVIPFPGFDFYDENRDEQRLGVAIKDLIQKLYPEQKGMNIKLPALRNYGSKVTFFHADNMEIFCDSSYYDCDETLVSKLKNADHYVTLGIWKPFNNT